MQLAIALENIPLAIIAEYMRKRFQSTIIDHNLKSKLKK